MKICPKCAATLPDIGEHTCPPERSIDLRLTRMESNFLAWCQAHTCAVMARNRDLAQVAYDHAVAYGKALSVQGINDLGDRHTLLAQAAWPDIKVKEIKYDKEEPGVSQ